MDPVNERRLRPVYDFIDAANYKKALQEVDKVLKKQKDFHCAKALKALALLRMGRENECKTLLTELSEQSPSDDASLQAITICYREMGQPELVTTLYERAVAKEPLNEELASHLFMSYVRIGDVKKQQVVAMNLYKMKPKNPYYFWSIMSLYLQAVNESDESKRKVLLTLAEKKIDKMVSEKKIEAEAEVELLLMILEKAGKYDQMIQVMEGPLGVRFLPNHLDFLNRRKALLHLKMGNTKRAFDAFKCLLDGNPDQMEYYRHYIETAFTLDQNESQKKHVVMAIEFIKKLADKTSKKKCVRGPHLAKIELYFHLIQKQQEDTAFSDLKTMLFNDPEHVFCDLFALFGHKNPFYGDVCYIFKKYGKICIPMLTALVEYIKSQPGFTRTNPTDLDHMKWLSAYYYIWHLSGNYDVTELTVRTLWDYFDCLPFGEGLTSSEINPSDELALLGLYIQGFELPESEPDNVFNLIDTCSFLAKIIKQSPANHTAKLMLILINNRLGLMEKSCAVFRTLETKYIMVDTLNYIIHPDLLSCGSFSLLTPFLSQAAKFYQSSCKDASDFTISCYKYGSFNKIEEIAQMRESLQNSLEYLCFCIDRAFLHIVLNSRTGLSKCLTDIEFDGDLRKKKDNRDIRVFCNTPFALQQKLDEWKDWSVRCDSDFYHFRSLLLQFISSCLSLFEDQESSDVKSAGPDIPNGTESCSKLKSLLDQMKASIERANECKERESEAKTRMACLPAVRLFSFLENESNAKQIFSFLELIVLFAERSKENTFTFTGKTLIQHVDSSVDYILSLRKAKSLLHVRRFLEAFAHQIELLSVQCLIISLISTILHKKSNTVSNKKNKKKDDEPKHVEAPETISSFNQLVQSIYDSNHRLVTGIEKIEITELPLSTERSEHHIVPEVRERNVASDMDVIGMVEDFNSQTASLLVLVSEKLQQLKSYIL